MNTQNILRYYGNKLDISIDTSELYDFVLDTSESIDLALDMSEFFDFKLDLLYDEIDYVDLVLDYSEYYDFEMVSEFEPIYEDNLLTTPIIHITNNQDYQVLTIDGFGLLTQSGMYIQYQH